MHIAILSDIHDHVWNLAAALEGIQDAETLICCGDLCSPFVIVQLAEGFSGPIHLVFGNNDGDQYRIAQQAGRHAHVHLHGEFFQDQLGGKRFAANHYNHLALQIARSEEYEVVCYGHNHIFKIEQIGKTLAINPGSIMGYEPGSRRDVPATLVIYNTETNQAKGYQVARQTQGLPGELIPYPGY